MMERTEKSGKRPLNMIVKVIKLALPTFYDKQFYV